MDEASRWREGLRNGYVLSQIYFAWYRTGVVDALRCARPPGATPSELAAMAGVSERILAPTLFYAAFADRMVVKEGDRYRLTGRGRGWFDGALETTLTAVVGAYGPVVENIEPALRGEREYGVDFERRGDLLAIASLGATRGNFPYIADKLRELRCECLVDLGCGAAGVLVEMCRANAALRGVGLDRSAEALKEAERHVADAGLSNRIELRLDDIESVDGWALGDLPETTAFHCTGVMHELLRDGPGPVLHFFAEIRARFPRRFFLLGEFGGRTEADYRSTPDPLERTKDLWYQDLIHPLSRQGTPQPQHVWRELLARAGVEILEVADFRHEVYVLRL